MTSKSLLRAVARPDTHPYVREALVASVAEDVHLSGACDPNTPAGAGLVPGFASLNGDEETLWFFTSPRQSGRSVADLVELFTQDERVSCLPFRHPVLDDADEDVLGRHHAFYDELQASESTFEPFEGLTLSDEHSSYCLVVHHADGNIAGLVSFELSLAPAERDLYCNDPEFEAATLSMNLRVSNLYVMREHRGKGAMHAACQAISHVVFNEVEGIGQQVLKVASALEERFKVEVLIESELFSQVARLVDHRLLSLVEGDLELLMSTAEPDSALAAVELLAVVSDSSW